MNRVTTGRRRFLKALGGAPLLFLARPLISPAAAAIPVGFGDLYERDAVLTERIQTLDGASVEMIGYMAPPLKAEATFFVLTRTPMAVCPFCETEAQWPDDIVLALTRDPIRAVPFNVRIRVTGVLELGFEKDEETGFVSLIRLQSADYDRA
jgi:hypothetical protein